jgi:hypothetical protein
MGQLVSRSPLLQRRLLRRLLNQLIRTAGWLNVDQNLGNPRIRAPKRILYLVSDSMTFPYR